MEYKNYDEIKTFEDLQKFINTCNKNMFRYLVLECTGYSEHGKFEEDDMCYKLCEQFVSAVPNIASTIWQMVALRCMKKCEENFIYEM